MAEISSAAVIAAAEEITGLHDFGGDEWREALDALTDALTAEAGLTEFGEVVAQGDLVGSLTRRLQIVEHRRTHPEVAEMRIQRPVFIVGQVRTGTTILYELLAQDPDARAPLTWE